MAGIMPHAAARRGRRLRAGGLAGLFVAAVLAWAGVLAFPSRTLVQVTITPQGATGRVNGSELRLTLPAAARPPAGYRGWYVAAPSETQYYEPDAAAVTLPPTGPPGAWFWWARPRAHWEFPAPPAGAPGGVAAWVPLYGDGPGAQPAAAVAPGSATAPGTVLTATLVGGRVPAGLLVALDGANNGYAFVVQPEARGLAWWRVAGGVPVAALAHTLYRPAFVTGLADLLQEAALALSGALALALVTLAIAGLWAALSRRAPVAAPGDEKAAAPGPAAAPARRPPGILRPPILLPLAFALAGTILAVATGLGPLEGVPHITDDIAYLWQGKIFALGHALVPPPPSWDFFDEPYVQIMQRGWFSKYPPGWPLLLAAGLRLGVPWLINPLAGGAALALIYATGRRLYGAVAGFWAAVLGLLSPFVVVLSGSYMSHATTMLAVALAFYAFVRLKTAPFPAATPSRRPLRDTSLVWAAVAGLGLGAAFLIREPTALAVSAPFVAWAVADGIGAAGAWGRARGRPGAGAALARRLAPYGAMVLGALPPLVLLALIDQAQMGSPFHLAQELVGPYNRLGFGPGFGGEPGGHSPSLGLFNTLTYTRSLAGVLFGWPLPLTFAPLLLALAATVGQPWRVARWALFGLAATGALVAIYFAYFSMLTLYGPRYWYEAVPFLLVLTGLGIARLGGMCAALLRAAGRPAAVARRAGLGAPAVVLAGLVLFNLTQTVPGQIGVYTGYNQIDASALRRVAAAHLDHALLFVALNGADPKRDYGKVFPANDPLLRGPVVYARDLGAAQNRTLLPYFPGRTPYYLPLEGPPQPGVGP